jgi:CRISPR-associated protein Cpf1
LKYIDNYSIIGKKDDKSGIMKDERFTVDKIQFHCPITINFKSKNKNFINDNVLEYLHKRDDVHIIGLDRGERHLIYLTMINKDGKIVDNMQFSLNELQRRYTANGKEEIQKINYQKLLEEREVSRTEARRNWQTIENIKNLKEGYLSLIIHKLASLMIEKNAIIVMENLNYGFKDSRAKVEKQIYQKFESMLIKKLQYLVMDKNNLYDTGGVLSAYQLTNQEVPAYKYMSKQNGFLFYVPPDYTSKIDPVTGFINLLDTRYYSRKNAVALLKKFDKIYYDRDNKYFRFDFDYNSTDSEGNRNFDKLRVDINELTRTKWSVCSNLAKRSVAMQLNNKWVHQQINVNDKLIKLFESQNINYKSVECLKEDILRIEEARFFEDLLKYLSVLLALRHTYKEDGVEYDTIVSSVESTSGLNEFFVSREGNDLPENADANGAYNIARKGLWLLKQLDKNEDKEKAIEEFNNLKRARVIKKEENKEFKDKKPKKVSQWCPNKEWLQFAQFK